MQKIYKDFDLQVGNMLRQLRVARGWSQEDIGNAIGISFQQIQKYEKGISRITVSRLYHIAKILDVAIEDFFPGTNKFDTTNNDNVATKKLSANKTEEARQVLLSFYAISDEELRKLLLVLMSKLANKP